MRFRTRFPSRMTTTGGDSDVKSPLMSIAEAALYLGGISANTVKRKAWAGEIACTRLGTTKNARLFFRREHLDEYIERCSRPAVNLPRTRQKSA